MVGLGGHEPDQFLQTVLGGGQDSAAFVGAHAGHQPFAVGVQQHQLTQRRGHLISQDDLVDRGDCGEPPSPQVIRRVRPVADCPLVVAHCTATEKDCTGRGQREKNGADGGYRLAVGTKAERQAARKAVASYHQARLGELIEHIASAIDLYRAGEVDVYTVDETIHHYHRAARELWKFCWSGGGTHIETVAHVLDRMTIDGDTIN